MSATYDKSIDISNTFLEIVHTIERQSKYVTLEIRLKGIHGVYNKLMSYSRFQRRVECFDSLDRTV